MDALEIALDAIRLGATIGLGYFVFYLQTRIFKAGLMESGFRVILLSLVFLCFGRLADLLSDFTPSQYGLLQNLDAFLGTLFTVTNAYGFYLIYRVWKPRKPSRALDIRA